MKASQATRKLTTMALLAALSIVLVALIHFPLFPSAAFLEYDPADIPIFICTFLFGPMSGLGLTLVVSIIQGTTVSALSGPIGIVMHFLATGSFSLLAGNIYKRNHTRQGALIALVCGVLVMTTVMVGCNLVFTPIFMGTPVDVVIDMLVPVIIPFNLLKATINAVITYFVYKPLGRLVHLEEKGGFAA
ncbi:ECF transporter S component [Youxingia wuxianensis]|uniref:Riboflavin transporter n=1 Tax=Youxingia wuxianensis TaxID=2763678 RepID=A0A926EL83_9FIRM|nr:ECF transporter S component [Youxingia wuxianensis]MBC8584435.1 ECF transporter S component [Youxingia wuxianensis]